MAANSHAVSVLKALWVKVLNRQRQDRWAQETGMEVHVRCAQSLLEALEPRMLLTVSPALAGPDHVLLAGDAAGDSLHLRVNDGLLEYSQTGLDGSFSADMDPAAGVQTFRISPDSLVSVDLGDGADSLIVDSSLGEALAAGGQLVFQGGQGNDALQGPTIQSQWNITGQDAGTLNARIAFAGVEALLGASGNEDTFRLGAGAGVSGLLDGGVGGYDTLVVDGSHGTVGYSGTGPHSGTITLDGRTLRYDGLEPVTVGPTANLTINGSSADDNLVLQIDPGDPTKLRVHSTGATIESLTFTPPTNSLTVNGGDGNDTLTLLGAVNLGTASLTATAETISLGATVNLTAGAVALTAARSLDLTTLNIAALLNSFHGASIVDVGHLIADFVMGNADATVNLTGATVAATSVTLSATSTVTGVTTGLLNSALSFTIPGFAAAFANVHSKADVVIDGGSITATGGLSLSAVADVHTGATATASASNANSAVDAAFALSVVDSEANARITGAAALSVGGALSVSATNTTQVTTMADGTGGGSTAAGGSIALAFVSPTADAAIEGSVATGPTTPTSVTVTATSLTDVTTSATSTVGGSTKNDSGTQGQLENVDAKSSSGETKVSIAGAFALTVLTADNLANVQTTGALTTTGQLAVRAYNDTDSATTADASKTGDGAPAVGVGVAVAANTPTVHNEAHVSGPVTAHGVQVEALMNSADADHKNTLGAKATSGASGTSVGAAGAFALNLVDSTAAASLRSGGAVDATGGDVLVHAVNKSDDKADAASKAAGSPNIGVGASVALNIALASKASATIEDGAVLSNADNLTLTAASDHTVATTSDAGSTGGTSVTPSVAVSYWDNETTAAAGTGGLLTVGGNLAATATGKSSVSSEAKADAEADKVAVGASIGVTVANEAVTATTARALDVTGNATFEADSAATSSAKAAASAKGASKDDTEGAGKPEADDQAAGAMGAADDHAPGKPAAAGTQPSAESSDGKVGVAAAIAVNVALSDVHAYVPAGGSVTAGGTLTLRTASDTDAASTADGSATDTTNGVGVAVAVNYAEIDNTAYVGSSASVTAGGLAVEAKMNSTDGDGKHDLGAQATAGAGAENVGVAGALALNILAGQTEATIDGAASVTLTGGGDVQLTAANTTADTVKATGKAQGGKVGVGAAVAINVVPAKTNAQVRDTAVIDGAGDLKLSATGSHTITTTTESGAEGGTAVSPAVAVVVTNNDTTATVGAGAGTTHVTGDLEITAVHTATVVTKVDASAAGDSVAVGAGVAVNVLDETATATLGRNLTADGNATIGATSTLTTGAETTASAKGQSESGKDADTEAGDQVNNNPTTSGHTLPTAQSGTDTADSSASSNSGGKGSGGVGVAAAISVNWLTANTTASIADSVQLTSGDVSVLATTEADATAKGQGTALNSSSSTNVGAAVGLNVATVHNTATVAHAAHVTGNSLTVEAVTPAGKTSDMTAWGLAAGGGKDTGAAGSVGINVATVTTEASIASGAVVSVTGDIEVTARADMGVQNIAGAGGIGKSVGVGIAIAANIYTVNTDAFIGNGIVDASGTIALSAAGSLSPLTLVLPLLPDPVVTSIAVGGGVTLGDAGVGGSAIVDVLTFNTHAYIADGAHVNDTAVAAADQSVRLTATSDIHLNKGAGGLGVAIGTAGVGIGLDVTVLDLDTAAYIAPTAVVHADDDVSLSATSTENILSVAVTASGGGSAGVSGSLVVCVPLITTRAYIGYVDRGTSTSQGATVHAGGDVTLTALNDETYKLNAGGASFGGTAGVGIAAVALGGTETVEAYIGAGSSIEARGPAGLALSATNTQDLQIISVAGSGGGTAGVAGSINANVLIHQTHAFIDGGAVTATSVGATNPGVALTATDTTDLLGIAGAVTFGGTAGVGAGLDVGVIQKDTQAFIANGVTVTADGNVVVAANSVEDVTSVSAAGSGGGTAGIAGTVGVYVLSNTTQAFIGHDPDDGAHTAVDTNVTADGNVIVTADDQTDLDVIAGNVTASGTASVGAAVGVPVVTKTTRAFLGNKAKVTAKGAKTVSVARTGSYALARQDRQFNPSAAVSGNAIDLGYAHGLATGQAVVYYNGGDSSITGLVDGTVYYAIVTGTNTIKLATTQANAEAGTFIAVSGGAATNMTHRIVPADTVSLPSISDADLKAAGVTSQRNVDWETKSVRGVAVTATNRDRVAVAGVSGGASGTVSVNVGGVVDVTTNHTHAFIADGAQVNNAAGNAGAHTDQSVLVGAGSDSYYLGIAGGLGASGTVAVTPSVAVLVFTGDTKAYIDDNTVVNAKGDVLVTARAGVEAVSVSAGVALSGTVSVAGSVGVIVLNDTTLAYIGNDATSLAGGAHVDADGNVLVSATDNTDITAVVGSLGIGFGAVGVGAAVGVTTVTKNTNAYVGDYATVNARGVGGTLAGILTAADPDADENSPAFTATSTFHGLAVQANSREELLTIAAAGAGGFYAGVAGGVSVEIVRSDTTATIGQYADINKGQAPANADPLQGINVSAGNDTIVEAVGGALGIGIAGIGGGVDVGIVRNNTKAYVKGHAELTARGDVDVNALSRKNVDTKALSVGGGIVGAAGSVSVWTIGTTVSSTYDDNGGNNANALSVSGGSYSSIQGFADAQAGGGDSTNGYQKILAGFSGSGDTSVQRSGQYTTQASGDISAAAPASPTATAISDAAAPEGTVAYVDSSASINAGGDVGVVAKENVDFTGLAGSAAGGGVAVGASIQIANIKSNTNAYIATGATVAAGTDVTVEAGMTGSAEGDAYAGTAGAAALGAQVVVITDTSTQAAHIDNGANVTDAGGTVKVYAHAVRSDSALAIGGSIAGVAAGVAVGKVAAGGSTVASIGSANVGQTGTVNNVSVIADSDVTANSQSYGVIAGLGGLAANGVVALATVNPTVRASIADGAHVTTAGDVDLQAGVHSRADTNALGVAVSGVGATLGISYAQTSLSPTVESYIGTGVSAAVIDAGGDVRVRALDNYTYNPGTGVYTRQTARGAASQAIAGSGSLVAALSGAAATAHNTTAAKSSVGASTSVTAGGDVSVTAKAFNDATSNAIGIAAAGLVGVGAPVATSTVDGTTWAHFDGAIPSAVNLAVTADSYDTATADTKAGTAGLLSGQINIARATVTQDIDAYLGSAVNVDVTGNVSVEGVSYSKADSESLGLTVGWAAIGAVLSKAIDAPVIEASIGGGSVLADGNVSVTGLHNMTGAGATIGTSSAVGTGRAAGGGVASGVGTDVKALADAKVSTHAGGVIDAGGAVRVVTHNYNDASAEADGMVAGLLGVGIVLADALSGAGYDNSSNIVRGVTESYIASSANIDAASLAVESTSVNNARGLTLSAGVGGAAGTGATAKSNVYPTVRAYIGGSAQVDVTGASGVVVTAKSVGDANSDAKALNVGGVAAGWTSAYATVASDVDAYTGTSAHVWATSGPVTITALHNMGADGSTMAKQANAFANAASAGVVSVQSAYADADSKADVRAYTGASSNLDAAGDTVVRALGFNDAYSATDGESFGVVGVGAVNADAYAGSSTAYVSAYLGSSSTTGGANVAVTAEHRANAVANVKQAAGGLITISGASSDQYGNKAFAKAQPNADAYVGASATVNTDADATVRALARGKADADSTGKNLGAVAVGKNIATAEWRPTVTAAINANSDVNAGDDIRVQAYNNYDTAGNPLSDQTAADATNSAGGIIGASGSEATVNVDSYTKASVGGGADLDAGLTTANGEIALHALSHNNTWAKANGQAFGGVAVGGASAGITVNSDTIAQTGDGTSGNRTHLASDTLTELLAVSDNDGNVNAVGASGGVASFGKAYATFTLASNNTWALVGAYNQIQGLDSTFNVHANSYGTMTASASQDSTINGISEAEAHATVTATSSSTKASIGANTTAYVAVIDVRSNDLGVDAQATAWANATVTLLYSNILGEAKVDLRGNSEVFVAAGANLTGYASLALVARQDTFRTTTNATAKIGGGVAGQTIATSDNTIDANSKVTTQAGSFLTTKDLFVQSLSPQTDNDWLQSASASSNTVVEWVWEVVGQACETIITILTFGLVDSKKVCKDVMGWVKHLTQTAVDENYYGSETRTNASETCIDFNSYVTILGPPNPYLTIHPDGSMDKSPNVTCTYDSAQNRWVVGDILNDSTGKVVIDSPPGTIVGNATFHFQDAFDRVDILNESDIDIEIHEISVWNQNKAAPDLSINVANDAGFTYTVTTSLGGSIIDIENTGNSDIYFDDFVQNPLGTTIVHNHGLSCDIFSVGYWGLIQSRIFDILSDHGQVGSSSQRLILWAVQGDGLATSVTATANLGVYLSIKGVVTDGTPLVLHLVNIGSTTSDVDVLFPQGVAPNGATTTFWCEPCQKWRQTWVTANVMETVDATIITAGGSIIGSAVNADVNGNVDLTGSGSVSFAADGDIDLTETAGDFRVGRIASSAGDVTLTAAGANMVDANADSLADVTGAHLTLHTPAGGIGTQGNPLDIDSTLLTVAAQGTVFIDETAGNMMIDQVRSIGGGAALRTLAGAILGVDDATTDVWALWAALYSSAGIGASGNALDTIVNFLEGQASGGAWVSNTGALTIGGAISDLVGLSAGGAVVVTTHSPLTVINDTTGATVTLTATDAAGAGDDLHVTSGATVQATAGDVELRGGDNVTLDSGTTAQATGAVNVRVDYGNADAGTGGTASLYGSIVGAAAGVYGDADNDTVRLVNEATGTPTTIRTYAGADTVWIHAAGAMTDVYGGDGIDTLEADTLPTMTTSVGGVRDSVNFDGEAGADVYIVRVTGGSTDYLVNVFDTGASGADALTVYGTAVADEFLLRASKDTFPAGVAFVAALHGTPVAQVERVNYNKKLENLVVETGGGDDHVTLDDNWALTTIRTGEGADHVQVGQIFKSPRDAAAGVASTDEFTTVQTTRGYLSNGVSYTTTIEGNNGNDDFTVFHNTATLNLKGGDGDDVFTVRAFALEGSTTTAVTGEGGADYVEYVANADVNVNGGDGSDTVRIIGTEFSDSVVITNAGIFGMGLTVNYTEIEVLTVDLAEGNDTFYILSTNADVQTHLFGGLGSDRFLLAGDVPNLMSGATIIFPATPGSHKTDGLAGALTIDGAAGSGTAGGLGTPVMLPGETNVLPTIGAVLAYTGAGTPGAVDTMRVPTAPLQGVVTALSLASLADLVGLTVEIGGGPGLGRFWLITGLTVDVNDPTQTLLQLKNPGQPAPEWTLPDSTSLFAISHLSSNFFVVESDQVDFATVYNDASVTNDTGTLTEDTLTGLNTAGVGYANLEGLDIFLGSGGDPFTVEGTMTRGDGFQTVTMLSTGAGNDTVTVNLLAGVDGFFSVNGEAGNDTIDASASTLPVVIFGGADDDTLTGGSGDDILFGDRGRVDYRDLAGTIVTRVGLGLSERTVLQPGQDESDVGDVPFKQTDGVVRGPDVATTRDAGVGGGDTILGGDGNDVIFGGSAGDAIGADGLVNPAGPENGNDVIVGDNGFAWFDSAGEGILLQVETTDPGIGLGDGIFGGAGVDVILGGAGGDTLLGGDDGDVILGDNGVVVFDAAGVLQTARTSDPDVGGYDTVYGGTGADIVLGGADHDGLSGDDGNDFLLGDNGLASFDSAGRLTTLQTTDPLVGSSDGIHGNAGIDTILGGTGDDTIHGEDGEDILLGDHGIVNVDAAGRVTSIETTDPALGGSDTIFGDGGNDRIAGGAAGDTISGGTGDDVILGDNARFDFTLDGNVDTLDRARTIDASIGGSDTISGNDGNDQILGGAGGDTLYGDTHLPGGHVTPVSVPLETPVPVSATWDDVILGDNGESTFEGLLPVLVITTDPAIGGDDTIEGNQGDDIILGGAGGDTIYGDQGPAGETESSPDFVIGGGLITLVDGDDVILGDNGRVDYKLPSDTIAGRLDISGVTLDEVAGTLDRVMTIDPTIGGNDTIYGNGGHDVVLGGTGDDTIYGDTSDAPVADDGSDVLMGDHGKFFPSLPWGQNVFAIDTGPAAGAGDDIIYGNGGDDFLFGQQGGDSLYGGAGEDDMTGGSNVIGASDGDDFMDGGDGADVMLGDNALIVRMPLEGQYRQWERWPAPSAQDVIRTVTRYDDIDAVGGDDTMYGQAGEDIMYGQRGDDTMYGGTGDDEMVGGLGADTLAGEAGRDFMLGDQGYFVRALNLSGTARINSDGSFHRDAFLEDVGTITGMIPLDKTALRTFDPQLASKIMLADMTVIAGVYNADGGKRINADTGAWDTEGLLIDLTAAYGDTMDGGDGNDFLVGQRGDDTISGGEGADLIVGDQIANVSPSRTDVPQVVQGVRLIGADPSVPVALNPLGSVIIPTVTVYPSELNNFTLPVITNVTNTTGTFLQAARGSSLARTDGRTMTPSVAVIPDVVHHADALPGNDTLYGGDGDDTIVGDQAVFYAPLLTGMVELDKAISEMTGQLIGLTQALHQLSLDFDVYEHQVLHLSHAHDVTVGQDTIYGEAGNDTLFGDIGMFASDFLTGLPVTEANFVAGVTAFYGSLCDLRDMTVDFGFVVQEARLQVLNDLTADALAKNPAKVKVAAKDVHDPDYHALYINSDTIDMGTGNDTAFGDDALYFTPVVNGQTYKKPAEYLNVTQATLNAAKKALQALGKVRDKQLADHVKANHASVADFRSRLPAAADLALAPFAYEPDRYVGNDTIVGGTGDKLIEADLAVLTMPLIVTAPATKQEIAQAARDAKAVADAVKAYVKGITTFQTGKKYFNKGPSDFNDKRVAGSDEVVFMTACDTIDGGTGTNVIFGGGLFLTVPFDVFAPGHLIAGVGEFNAEMPRMQENRRAALKASGGQKYSQVFANDLITVYGTNDSVFGGGGKNSVVVTPGCTISMLRITSGSVPDVKTAVPMRQFTLSNLAPTISTTVLNLSAPLPAGETQDREGVFYALFL